MKAKFIQLAQSHQLFLEVKNEVNSLNVNKYIELYTKIQKQQKDFIISLGYKLPKFQHEYNNLVNEVLINYYNENNFKFNTKFVKQVIL